MRTVLSIVGTRPEAIKMAPVIEELRTFPERVRPLVCVTGQHREMVDQVLELFAIRPDFDLDLMKPGQSLAGLTASLFVGLDGVLDQCRPDWVLAQGDTTTVLVASLTAFYRKVKFGHVEAGLRTGDLSQPFPEELNRRVADDVADLLFAPTERNRRTLLREGVADSRIAVTGNPGIDALRRVAEGPYDWSAGPLAAIPADRRLVLVTAHRRENFGAPIRRIGAAVRELAERFPSGQAHFVVPLHPNPEARAPLREALAGLANLSLIDPLDYRSLVHLMKRSVLVLTDSGGIQEEAPAFGVPVLVLRSATERTEGLETGLVRLVGSETGAIVAEASRVMSLLDTAAPRRADGFGSPYGDGHAAERIVKALLEHPS